MKKFNKQAKELYKVTSMRWDGSKPAYTDGPIIEIEHEVPTERTLKGFFIMMFCVIFVEVMAFVVMENIDRTEPETKTKDRIHAGYFQR